MPTEKRQRQRENAQQARQLRQKGAKRAKLRSNAIRFGGVALAVIAVGFLLSRGGTDATPTTTIAEVAATTTPITEATSTPTTQVATTEDVPMGDPIASPAYESFRNLPVVCGGEAPPPATSMTFSGPEDQAIDPDGEIRARIMTSCGEIVVRLDPAAAPNTVNSFAFLARQGFYDGTVSHRIIPGFMYQAGDPTATGSGGPGYQYQDELPPADFTYTRGTLAMANAGPNTNGSQFFIMFKDTALPPNFTVFGQVESGLDVLDKIEAVSVAGDRPTESLYISTIRIEG
ncbi:MAG: peptidylprolyl isomerase [Acidimicrobiia bacterium]